ncbi:hypothetical protein Rcae01_04477 [Novipirellula caenicola]|uniref:Uncharacterized protein n=1 Tax=Novipirellula caenicola TaxID=1536901 RepID=A0ABP9VV48_9BACT
MPQASLSGRFARWYGIRFDNRTGTPEQGTLEQGTLDQLSNSAKGPVLSPNDSTSTPFASSIE